MNHKKSDSLLNRLSDAQCQNLKTIGGHREKGESRFEISIISGGDMYVTNYP